MPRTSFSSFDIGFVYAACANRGYKPKGKNSQEVFVDALNYLFQGQGKTFSVSAPVTDQGALNKHNSRISKLIFKKTKKN